MIRALKQWFLACSPDFVRCGWNRIEASPLGYRLARGAFWSLVGTTIARSLSLAASIVVARLLGKEGFGEFGIIQSTVGMFGTLAGFGLGLTATKHVAAFRDTDPARAGRILSLSAVVSWGSGALMAAGLVLLSPWLAARTLGTPQIAAELQIGSLLVLFGAVNGAQTGALAGFEAFRRIAQLSLWVGLANFPLVALGCLLFGLPGAVWGLVITQAIGCALYHAALSREASRYNVRSWARDWRKEMPLLWSFSLPAVAGGILTSIARWASHAIIVRQPEGLAAMAVCSIGAQFQTLILFLPALATQASFPIISELAGKGEWRRTKRFVYRNFFLNLGITAAFCVPLILLAKPILGLYGASFRNEQRVFIIFLLVAVLSAASRFLAQVLASQDAMRFSLMTNLAWSVLLVGTVLLFREPGAMAFAIAQLIAYSAHLGMPMGFLHWRFSRVQPAA